MITPRQIQEIADPVEGIYINCVNELMVNIGKHITSPTWTHTASWEIQKLSEMGQLTKENAEIINKWIKQIPPAMRSTMEATRAAALDRIEKQMENAVKDGAIQPPLADSTVQVFKDYADQAVDKMNMVNTTMLQSTLTQYQRAVALTEEIVQQAENTQAVLNEAAGSVLSGVETRTKAMQRAIKTIGEEGLTGFYDRAGRSWTPEAYVNMVIRTTVHNTAIQATQNRMQDYGTDVFQISSHAGARPLCYPYQGWFCSWSNKSGEIELGDGSVVQYKPLNETSYGQPAGIFGINCGHYPIPIIAGYTIPHGADNIQPEEENDKAYALSQEQRALERQIRAAKRVVEMGDTSDEAKQAVKDAQAKMRQFIAETGRTRRYDRESLYGSATKSKAPAEKVNAQLTEKKDLSVKVKDSEISDMAKQNGIQYNAVKRHDTPLTEEQIISAISGGDRTKGSCASAGLCYVGQKQGLDVLDFRGGDSQSFFSKYGTIRRLKNLQGIVWDEQSGNYEQTVGNQLLKRVQKGKQYYFCAGAHAAIVQRTDDDRLQYLELQSEKDSGWHFFNKNARYTLSNRFGCSSSRQYWGTTAVMFEVDSLKDSEEFAMILGYLNTAKDEQRKGLGGTIK